MVLPSMSYFNIFTISATQPVFWKMFFKLKVVDAPAILFKIFYFITKANGLLPVTIKFHPLTANSSFVDVFYSMIYALIVIVCLPYSQSIVLQFIGILKNPKVTIIFVFLIQVACSAFRMAAIYVSQISNHKTLSNFINRSVQINGMFVKGNKQKSFLDAKLSKWCISKFISTIFQVVFMLIPSVGFASMIKSSENFLFLLMCFLFILYSHLVLILSTAIYFTGMIVIGIGIWIVAYWNWRKSLRIASTCKSSVI